LFSFSVFEMTRYFIRMMAQETMEKTSSRSRTNCTIGPASTTIWRRFPRNSPPKSTADTAKSVPMTTSGSE